MFVFFCVCVFFLFWDVGGCFYFFSKDEVGKMKLCFWIKQSPNKLSTLIWGTSGAVRQSNDSDYALCRAAARSLPCLPCPPSLPYCSPTRCPLTGNESLQVLISATPCPALPGPKHTNDTNCFSTTARLSNDTLIRSYTYFLAGGSPAHCLLLKYLQLPRKAEKGCEFLCLVFCQFSCTKE